MSVNDPQPLDGVRVLDFTQVMLGPSATQVLADYGADVIKVERPGAWDLSRTSVANDPDGLDNPVFRSLNRNKRSIVLDLRKPAAKELIYELVGGVDIVANNFRAGVMERMGFGYETLSKINPRVICAFGSGFGQTGPLAYKGGQDILAQALSGVMRRKCNDDEPLTIYATSLCDYSAGMHLVQAILLALLQREKTGRGQQVAVSLFESMLAMQMQEAAMYLQRDLDFSWGGYPLTGVFPTRDGALVLVGAFKSNPLKDICAALGLPDLSADARYADFAGQAANKKFLQATFRERFASETTEFWLKRLDEQDLLCAPVLSMPQALAHEQTLANKSIVGLHPDGGGPRAIGSPLSMAEGAFRVRLPPPKLGADSADVLREAGLSSERIAALKAEGLVA
jgi:crotonobetainyl-CoA:carnitine CoA-transferase CaiB-like acyl-CoA transferase